jgi:hypothetical protein
MASFHVIAERACQLKGEGDARQEKEKLLEKLAERFGESQDAIASELEDKSKGILITDLYRQLEGVKPEYIQQAIGEYLEAEKAKCNTERKEVESTEGINEQFLDFTHMSYDVGRCLVSGLSLGYTALSSKRKMLEITSSREDYTEAEFAGFVGGTAGILFGLGLTLIEYGWKVIPIALATNIISAGYELYRLKSAKKKKIALEERETKITELEALLNKNNPS